MPGNNNSNSEQQTKLITLDNLSTYTGYIEEKNVRVTREQYTNLPSTKLTDGKSYYITDEGIIIKNGVTYGAAGSDTTYSLSVGTGDDANKIILTPSSGNPDKVTVPYASNAGTVNSHTVASDVPADAVFTDNNTTYGLSVGTGDDANKVILTPSTGNADKITVPYATSAGDAGTVNGKTVAVNVPADAVFTDTTYSDATTSASGLMSASDKTTINSLGTAAFRDIPTSGDASTSEVVLGTDSRLTDARNAADVYSWAKAATKPSYTASEVGAIASTEKGANNGVAELDSTGKVPSSQLPSYVDDVLEYNSSSDFPLTGETGKIYIAKDTNKTYRWSGSAYVEISESLALGETSSTAYAGNKGKANADAIAAIKDGSTIDSFGDVETALTGKVDSIAQGTANGTISVTKNGSSSDVAVKGIQNSAYNNTFIGTEDEWDNLTTEQKKAYDEYKITDDYVEPTNPVAEDISYDNTSSGLTADNVQDAIDELSSEKKDEYTTITYAQWQQLTPTQQAEKDYYISDYPSSAITAGNVNYNNTTSGMSANNVQGAVDELKSGLIDINGNLANKEPLGGTATGNKTFYVGDKLYFKTDGEGGNIIIKSPTNIAYEADAYNGSFRFRTTKSGTGKSITWDGLEAISLNDLKKYKVDGKLIQYLGSTNTIIDVSNVTNLATLSVGNYQDAAIFMIYKESGTSIFIQKLAGSSTLSLTYSESNKLVLHNDNPAGGCAMLTYSTSF